MYARNHDNKMNEFNMKRVLLLLLLPISSYAYVPDFQCWDIHNFVKSTEGDIYATRYLDKMPPPYGSFHYETAPNDANYYRELVIINQEFDDGFYYGSEYMNREGTLYNDIKCQPIHQK